MGESVSTVLKLSGKTKNGLSIGVLESVTAKEFAIGLFIGFFCALIFYAALAAGNLIDTARGQNIVTLLKKSIFLRSIIHPIHVW